MLVTALLRARFLIDLAIAHEPGGIEAATHHIIREVIAAGDQRAYRVREESVHVGEPTFDNSRMEVTLDAVWSPLSAVLVGGEYDGERINPPRESDGLPVPIIALPYRASSYFSNDPATAPQNPSYRRSGIDPITDEWVYQLAR